MVIDALADADRDAAVMAMTRHLRHIVEAIERLDQPQQVNGRSNGIAPVHTLYAD